MSKIKIALFDAHSFDDRWVFNRIRDNEDFKFSVYEIGEKPIGTQIVLISDSLSLTKLPFFFPRNKRICWLKESPVHTRRFNVEKISQTFDVVLTHREDLIESGPPFYRVDFSANWIYHDECKSIDIQKCKLTSFIGNINHLDEAGYPFRKNISRFLLSNDAVDCYGWGIKPIDYKIEGLANYCFSIAMENSSENYYYTEKIIDCFLTETVPIYWGCPKIHEIYDSRGILTFTSIAELEKILNTLSFNTYKEMLPYVMENKRRCIKKRLSSYDEYLSRCVETCLDSGKINLNSLKSWEMSKFMAGMRYLRSLI